VFTRTLDLAGQREALAQTHAYFRIYLMRVERRESDAIVCMVDFWFGGRAYCQAPSTRRAILNATAEWNPKDVQAAFVAAIPASQQHTIPSLTHSRRTYRGKAVSIVLRPFWALICFLDSTWA